MEKIKNLGSRTFSSLKVKNYRLYFIGQGISLCGTWMQTIGQGLLVLKLTGSGTDLGIVTALQFLPILIFGPLGGVAVDRYSKRKILYITQSAAGILALILGLLVILNQINIWEVYILALGLGLVNAFDNPTRQTFLIEMVGNDEIKNAISLNSTEINLARVIGPMIAGILISTLGIALCFIINAVSYIAVLIVLSMMDINMLHISPAITKTRGQLMEGIRYIKSNHVLRNTLIMMAIIGTFTFEFQVVLPLFAEFTFHGDAGTYTVLTAAMGLGSVVGGLYSASRHKATPKLLILAAILFGGAMLLTSLSPTFNLAIAALVLVGIFSINFTTMGNVILQLETTPEMRGRVMSFWTLAFLGSTPIGGPIIGFIGEYLGARYGFAVGGLAAMLAACFGVFALQRNYFESSYLEPTTEGLEEASEKDSRIF